MASDSAHYRETRYGFEWGPLVISRVMSDDGWGVMVEIRTPRQSLNIRVTPSGLIRIGEIQKQVRSRSV